MTLHAIARFAFWIVAAFYAYGALVHILNILSLTGFNWTEAPTKWQALDIVYLILDVTVVFGLLSGARIGIYAFFCADLSQIAPYTLFRDWALDVPDAFRPSPEEVGYLDTLVIFHAVTIAVMALGLFVARIRRWQRDRAPTNYRLSVAKSDPRCGSKGKMRLTVFLEPFDTIKKGLTSKIKT